ncbi:hypothetical protein SPRG_14099 [Saprolegnia parasitica CBS 223.65]|uniref:SP-RING-type domain-containing protein n=1 Tax=Saprolegnia parasitica (strain CBS 223.65) TaxID=695850 RepID=A0A067BRI5_SAPPC|nr:hypothetical protein SPRG_14099 [Saprolegnia parasitica CBS 223.65]KDO20868.1 hypothetical protein SPRG_14099 [Saprolegnia parasitica CBS 223.65]|eukprot:XP_012208446.1 hypothetical protein SPRG_14099 [Saprolegnia parasitica CBS 223.65]
MMAGRAGKRKAMVDDSDSDDPRIMAREESGSEEEAAPVAAKSSSEWEAIVNAEVNETLPAALQMCVSNAKKQRQDLLKRVLEGAKATEHLVATVKDIGDDNQIEVLKGVTTNFVQLHGRISAYEKKLEGLSTALQSGRVPSTYRGALNVSSSRVSDAQVMQHDFYKRFCGAAGIEEEGDDDDVDVLVQETEAANTITCPITLLEMVEPVRNKRCGHTYSKAGITAHLKRKNACPIGGCREKVGLHDLERDVEMEVRIASNRRAQATQQLNSTNAAIDMDDDDDDDEILEHNVE